MRSRVPQGLLLLFALSGCSAASTTAGGASSGRNIDIIVQSELAATNRSSAYEAIEMLRPQWLSMRSAQSVNRQGGGIIVYLDDVRYGDIESLRTIHISGITQMQRFNATAASQRWGPGHSDGVIVVSTRSSSGG